MLRVDFKFELKVPSDKALIPATSYSSDEEDHTGDATETTGVEGDITIIVREQENAEEGLLKLEQ